MNFWSKVKLSDFLLLYFTNLLGKFLSGQIYTFSSISIACAVILTSNTLLFLLVHFFAPYFVKTVKKFGVKKTVKTFLEKVSQTNAYKNVIQEEDDLYTKLKSIIKKAFNVLATVTIGYALIVLIKWALPYSNFISGLGSIIVIIFILARHGFFLAFLADDND